MEDKKKSEYNILTLIISFVIVFSTVGIFSFYFLSKYNMIETDWKDLPSNGEITMVIPIIENSIKQELTNISTKQVCRSVKLLKKDNNIYTGFAEFTNGENIEITLKIKEKKYKWIANLSNFYY